MAKAATVTANSFKIETGVALPAITRGIGGGTSSPYAVAMKALELSADPKKLQSFYVPCDAVPATVTGEDEKAKWLKENARKIANRISGVSRRITKDDSGVAFAIRSMPGKDGTGMGVRVFRVAPKATA